MDYPVLNEDTTTTLLSEEDFNWLLAELDKPPQVLPGLIELMNRPTPFNLDEPFQASL
jgi:uncharacterized protein (DUF1778 family)